MKNFENDWLKMEVAHEGRLNLPEDTPVYIVTTHQVAFFERPANSDGASRIKNIGVVFNDELREPTIEELQKWGESVSLTKGELERYHEVASKNWGNLSVNK